MGINFGLGALTTSLLNFALPPRCAGCGEVVDSTGTFCAPCCGRLEWLGTGGCERCGLPLEATELDLCGRCLSAPPKLDRIRAAVAYSEVPRSIVLRLKYGRKVGLARTMGRYMAPLRGPDTDATVIAPVPLHRWRLWNRGFNQSQLIARELARLWGLPVDPRLVRRARPTRPLKGLNHRQRRNEAAGAFRASIPDRLTGVTVILIDDVLTSGSTADGCAKALLRAGAGRVELICWARVVRPTVLAR